MKGLFIEFWAGLGKAAKNTTVSRASSGEAADGHLPCLSICSCTPHWKLEDKNSMKDEVEKGEE